ncbi:MAG: ATP-grasp domain-containing protein [Planctomycetes bacterium]|nr:ATP-grasp domain-containing protein [Planctomycetota bacterium]
MPPKKRPVRQARNDAKVRLLFTCVGRRIELLDSFRAAAKRLKIKLEIHGTDASSLSPGMHCVDVAHLVPTIRSRQYIDTLLSIVRRHKIGLLIPLIDSDLIDLAGASPRFEERGCRALVSPKGVIQVCRDKLATFDKLKEAGLDTPDTWTWREVMQKKRHRFPYFLKPRKGSAAMGNYVVRNRDELRSFGKLVEDPIVQEFVEGIEHTLDVYTGLDGVPRCVVPRKRLEVRAGEVSKSVVVKNRAIMAIGRKVAEVLGDCRGVITVQCIVTRDRRIRVIEINPRFGGGVPLAIHAGADFPKWILQEHLGRTPRISSTGFKDDVAMLRFDQSVFVNGASKLTQKMSTTRSKTARR